MFDLIRSVGWPRHRAWATKIETGGRDEIGKHAGFRCQCSKELGGSSPSARINSLVRRMSRGWPRFAGPLPRCSCSSIGSSGSPAGCTTRKTVLGFRSCFLPAHVEGRPRAESACGYEAHSFAFWRRPQGPSRSCLRHSLDRNRALLDDSRIARDRARFREPGNGRRRWLDIHPPSRSRAGSCSSGRRELAS
jgi:hypothetical protein